MKKHVAHSLDWFLIAWAVISAVAAPFIGRFVGDRLNDVETATAESPSVTQLHSVQPANRPDAP